MWEDTLKCKEYNLLIVLKDPAAYATKDPKNIPFTEYKDKLWHEIRSCIKPDTEEGNLFFQFVNQIKNLRAEKAKEIRKAKALSLQIYVEDDEFIVSLPGKQGIRRIKPNSESKKKKK